MTDNLKSNRNEHLFCLDVRIFSSEHPMSSHRSNLGPLVLAVGDEPPDH